MSAASRDGAGSEPADASLRMHATCVAFAGKAVLLRGPPGAGKSDLALRLIAGPTPDGAPPAALVADDQVAITRNGVRLTVRAPETIAGMLEVRGVGIRQVRAVPEAAVALIVDLVASEAIPRLPPDPLPSEDILGLPVSTTRLAPFEPSAPVKLRLLMGALGGASQ